MKFCPTYIIYAYQPCTVATVFGNWGLGHFPLKTLISKDSGITVYTTKVQGTEATVYNESDMT